MVPSAVWLSQSVAWQNCGAPGVADRDVDSDPRRLAREAAGMVDQANESDCRECAEEAAARHGLRRQIDRRHSLPARRVSPPPERRPRPHRRGARILAAALERFGARICYNGRNTE